MTSIKVIGAGSIGNHLSNAARSLGWSVDLCDVSEEALQRTKTNIYPTRYGAWDEEIRLHRADRAPRGGHDLIVLGTPPDSHIDLALAAIEEQPKAILVEKPVCTPDLNRAQVLVDAAHEAKIAVFAGYDHVVGKSVRLAVEAASSVLSGPLETIDVEFREHWGGIFDAHPWLDGPQDSYLGFWRRGGGASGEHSHAVNLWQHFALALGAGQVVEVSANLDYVREGGLDYDKLCLLTLTTESGLMGRVVQDVVTRPARKWARIQKRDGFVEWHCGWRPGCDAVISDMAGVESRETLAEKSRPDDFIWELEHIERALASDRPADSPISLRRGLDTMMVVAASHISAREARSVTIDYDAGYIPAALKTAGS